MSIERVEAGSTYTVIDIITRVTTEGNHDTAQKWHDPKNDETFWAIAVSIQAVVTDEQNRPVNAVPFHAIGKMHEPEFEPDFIDGSVSHEGKSYNDTIWEMVIEARKSLMSELQKEANSKMNSSILLPPKSDNNGHLRSI